MSRRTLVKRVRRRLAGGRLNLYVYSDGTARIHYDHPSDDPAVELAIAGHTLHLARSVLAEHGYLLPDTVPITWRSDPSEAP